MLNTADNMDFSEAGDDQLSRLQAGETDTAAVIQINDLRQEISAQLSRAEEEGVISGRDVKELNERLKNAGNSKQEVSTIGHEVSSVIAESKRLIAELPSGDKEIAVFKEMSLREKKEYVVNLRKAADDLNKRADRLGELFPDAAEKLKTLEGVERARFIEELNIRRTNVFQYDAMMEEHSSHFSKKSQDEYMAMFKELSLSKQEEWLKLFVETQAKPRAKLSARYEALPPKIRERVGDFYELARHDKEKKVVKAEEEKVFADKLYGNPDHKYMSSKARKFMKKTFIGADSNLRKAMMEMLDKVVKDEAEVGRKFERLPAEVRQRCVDFMEKDFEEKKETLEKLLGDDYERRLNPWLEKKVIGESTVTTFMDWFRELDLNGKLSEGTDAKIKGQMQERIVLKDRFEKELPEEVKKANAHFYGLGHHARMGLFEKLKGERAAKAGGVEAGAGVEQKASQQKKTGGEAAGSVKSVPGEVAGELDESAVKEQVGRVKGSGELMRKKIRDENIAEGLADLAEKSDLANQGVYDSVRKDKHLHGAKERKLNDELLRFSGGKAVAESGHKKAKKVKEIDLDKLNEGVVTEDVMLDLKKEVVNNRGDGKDRNVFHLQFADAKSGQKLSGAMGKRKTVERKKELHGEIADKVAVKMGLTGKDDDRAKKERLRKIVERDDLKVDLREVN